MALARARSASVLWPLGLAAVVAGYVYSKRMTPEEAIAKKKAVDEEFLKKKAAEEGQTTTTTTTPGTTTLPDVIAPPPPPRTPDRCSALGCGVWAPNILDRSRVTFFTNKQIADQTTFLSPGVQVRVIDDGHFDIRQTRIVPSPGAPEEDGLQFTPNLSGGGRRFLHIQFCYPPGPPEYGRCIEGWTPTEHLIAP